MQAPRVAVVILNFNGIDWLRQFLPGVMATDYPELEVIIADNASTDGSVEWLKEVFPGLRLIVLQQNYGFAEGYNRALEQVQAEYFVLLNSDVRVEPDWLHPIITCMESDKNIGACQPRILSFHQPDYFEYAGAAGGWIDVLGYPFARGRVMDTLEPDKGQYSDTCPIFWATGAALCVRSAAWKNVGGFDSEFFAHQEEIDLCWRLQLMGWGIRVCGASRVFHVGGGTLPVGPRKTYLNFRNNLLMLGKNLTVKQQCYILPLRLFLDGVAALRALLSGRVGEAWAIVRAHFFVFSWWIRGKNKNSKHRKPISQLGGVYSGWLLIDYFLRGKKLFSEIILKNR
ncbi:MAG: glycosyltransferase family 2 protein [Sediminibacterium sp.]|nr:glycosyltransferase family 2 protein [Sediminibacterium sp.]